MGRQYDQLEAEERSAIATLLECGHSARSIAGVLALDHALFSALNQTSQAAAMVGIR